MDDKIFREKSLKKISSPESLNDYVKVSNPGVWVLLVAVITLLIGLFAWGVFGKIDSSISTIGVVKNGNLDVYIKEDDLKSVNDNSFVEIEENEFPIVPFGNIDPLIIDYDFSDSYLHIANMEKGEWVYKLNCKTTLPDGVYKVNVITERIKPISLLFD